MSYAAQAWVNDHAPYSAGAERAVLKELADAMSKDGEVAWQGIDRLALDSGYSRASVCRALRTMLCDGVIERAGGGGGRGIKAGYRIVQDKRAWTLSRATVAQMTERAGQIRALEERRAKGLKVRRYRGGGGGGETVSQRDGLSTETVSSERLNSLTMHKSGDRILLYEPDLTRADEIVKTEGEAEQRLNPRVGELVKGLVERMDRRARAGVRGMAGARRRCASIGGKE
jgi:hypothetical protein